MNDIDNFSFILEIVRGKIDPKFFCNLKSHPLLSLSLSLSAGFCEIQFKQSNLNGGRDSFQLHRASTTPVITFVRPVDP